jgi:hypothetical protein
MDDPRRRQSTLNSQTRGLWESFTGHRGKVTGLLAAGADAGRSRLCVLGAGNANDLDLPALLAAHREVHLVDLDGEALRHGAGAQGVAGRPSLHLHGGVDLTGMVDVIAGWSPRSPIPDDAPAALAEAPAARVAPRLPGPFDLVASTCLLTQLVGAAYHAVGEQHPRFPELVRAVRAGHLRLLDRLGTPSGTVVLVTDVVSSDTLPELGSLPEGSLPALLPRLARERNFFHGVNPAALWSVFRNDPALRDGVSGLESLPPWRWDLRSRLYLVWALRYSCRADRPK